LARALEKRYPEQEWWVATQDTLHQQSDRIANTDLVVTVGGDGTILRGVHIAAPRGIPVLGVNMGRVGFMSEIDADDALAGVGWYLEGGARIEERAMLRAEVEGQQAQFDALNDVIIARGETLRVIQVATRIDGVLLAVYRGDGVVVATATGSTGYTLALGGPVMDPSSEDMLLKPVAAHMSQFGGVVVRSTSLLDLTVMSVDRAMFSADGFLNTWLHDGQSVRVMLSPFKAKFLRRQPQTHFWSSLSRRLGMRQGALPRKAESDGE
jgi:NAD+ kinase